jgi:hypothetical protein
MVEKERRLPPISELCIVTMSLVIVGGVYVAGHLPDSVPMTLPVALLIAAAAVLAVNLVLLSKAKDFDWATFWLVARWSFAAYLVIAGMLEYIFLRNNTPDDVMLVLSGMLAVYAVDIPLLFGFSVARYQEPSAAPARPQV